MSGTPVYPSGVPRGGGLMRSHTVTVYNELPEANRKAAYQRTVIAGVRLEERSGAVAALNGKVASSGMVAYIPGNVAGYKSPEAWAGLAGSQYAVPSDALGWTLRDGDLLVVGECPSDIPPLSVAELERTWRVYRITGVQTMTLRNGRVHHWEVASS